MSFTKQRFLSSKRRASKPREYPGDRRRRMRQLLQPFVAERTEERRARARSPNTSELFSADRRFINGKCLVAV